MIILARVPLAAAYLICFYLLCSKTATIIPPRARAAQICYTKEGAERYALEKEKPMTSECQWLHLKAPQLFCAKIHNVEYKSACSLFWLLFAVNYVSEKEREFALLEHFVALT
jgi:hypothetical protein